MTSSEYPSSSSVLHVAGATIHVDWANTASERRASFEVEWCDVIVNHGAQPEGWVSAADHAGPGELVLEIKRVAREALRSRDVWTIRGSSAAYDGSAVIVVGADVEERLNLIEGLDGALTLGHELITIDPQGAVLSFREPFHGAAPSSVDTAKSAPSGVRVGVFILLDDAEGARGERLDLAASLQALSPFLDGFEGAPAPLRSLARVLAASGGVIRAGSRGRDEIADLIGDLRSNRPERIPALSIESSAIASQLDESIETSRCFRAGVADALYLSPGEVLLLRRCEGGHTMFSLDRQESAVWRAANGDDRMTARSVAAADLEAADASELDEVFARMEAEGLLAPEPSWYASTDAAWVVDDDRAVVLDLTARVGRPLVLEASARAVWLELARNAPMSRATLMAEVAAQYGVEPDLVESDVDALLARLHDENLAFRL